MILRNNSRVVDLGFLGGSTVVGFSDRRRSAPMVTGPFAGDDRPGDGLVDGESTSRPYDVSFIRAMKRRGWTGGGLAASELVNWFGHNPVVQSVTHVASLPLAGFLALDIGWTLAVKIYRSVRRKIIIIDLSGNGSGDYPRRSDPRYPDDRPYTHQ
jgi:hypothetical protein